MLIKITQQPQTLLSSSNGAGKISRNLSRLPSNDPTHFKKQIKYSEQKNAENFESLPVRNSFNLNNVKLNPLKINIQIYDQQIPKDTKQALKTMQQTQLKFKNCDQLYSSKISPLQEDDNDCYESSKKLEDSSLYD